MKRFVRKHKYKIAAAPGLLLAAFFITSSLLATDDAILFFATEQPLALTADETVTVDVKVNSYVPIDAVGGVISYPADRLELLKISKEHSFLDLWIEDPTIEVDEGMITFSGGITAVEGHMGTGTIMTLTFKGKAPGNAHLYFESVSVYPHDGSGKSLQTATRTINYIIASSSPPAQRQTTPTIQAAPSHNMASSTETIQFVKGDLNGDGVVSLTDLSVLMFSMLGTYNMKYDLNEDGVTGIADISILLSLL